MTTVGNLPANLVANRSTKGASKQRREQINKEIDILKDLLPLPQSVRQRLFQLQVMCLGCIYIRKERFLPHVLRARAGRTPVPPNIDVYKTIHGFLMLMTRQGKLLYLSDNVSDYLGHSAGDNLYDLIDSRDHHAVQSELLGSSTNHRSSTLPPSDTRLFMCRMNLTRAAKRQPHYQKYILIYGSYLHPVELYQSLLHLSPHHWLQPVFAAFCYPLITPDIADLVSSGNTLVFSSMHGLDMRFIHLDEMGIYHLGYPRRDIEGKSWYKFLYPADVLEAGSKHKQVCDEKEPSATFLIRFRAYSGSWLWLYTVLCLKEEDATNEDKVRQVILATYQMLSDVEALTLKSSGWLQMQATKLPKLQSNGPSPISSDLSVPLSSEPAPFTAEEAGCVEFAPKPKRKNSPRSKQRNYLPPPLTPCWSEPCNMGGAIQIGAPPPPWRCVDMGPPTPQTPSQLSPSFSLDSFKTAFSVKSSGHQPISHTGHPLTPDDSPNSNPGLGPHGGHPQLPQKPPTPPLPIIEPSDLEAYLAEVEREGSIHIDGVKSLPPPDESSFLPLPVERHVTHHTSMETLCFPQNSVPPKSIFGRRCSENLSEISHSHFRHAGRLSFSGGCG